jgi:MFS family permease
MAATKNHDYHILPPDIWPLIGATSALSFFGGMVMWMHDNPYGKFLILLGFSPVFWMSAAAYYIRLALMNMSGPVYQTFVMEHVEPSTRATVASLVSMANSFGWAFSPTISGWIQVRYGFGPAFLGTIVLYTISVWMYWAYFWGKKPVPKVSGPDALANPGD